jgi:Fur family ferric uptake transcriptional regulator
LTVQRRTVAEVLSAPDLHLTAEEIFARARERVPEISRATVYNTLADLQAMGEVEEVQLTTGPVRYDPNANVAHHHLVCENCGEIHDVHPRGLEHLGLSQRDQESFELETVEVTFRGICSRCAEHAT